MRIGIRVFLVLAYLLAASAAAQTVQVNLAWEHPDPVAVDQYHVYRSQISGGPYAEIGQALVCAYTDVLPYDGLTYYYVVTAANHTGASCCS
ncbi:MAG: hypothetical protein ABIG68_05230 [Acidobacteriota bacterium]